jgi:NADH dehydrogenase FAD-containing subunit
MFKKALLFGKVLVCLLPLIWHHLRQKTRAAVVRQQTRWFGSTPAANRDRTIVIVGASFAGYYTARFLALGLPPFSRYRIVVIEPNSHFQFSWVLPRYCVARGHEHKAFIPYGGHIRGAPEGSVRWVRDRVIEATKTSVKLEENGEIPYDYLVIATGSGVQHGLPSRVNETDKLGGMKRIQAMQTRVKDASNIVIGGGGAAGVELAADAKDLYPEKNVILVHSRSALMHRFSQCLQDEALKSLKALGVGVILNDRIMHEDTDACTVMLRSGRSIDCDFFVSYNPTCLPCMRTSLTTPPCRLIVQVKNRHPMPS